MQHRDSMSAANEDRLERNQHIVMSRRCGASTAALARSFGLSRRMIQQIVKGIRFDRPTKPRQPSTRETTADQAANRRRQRKAEARELRQRGYTFSAIALALGVSVRTAVTYTKMVVIKTHEGKGWRNKR